MEEKLKNFGELLKETLGGRSEELPAVQESSSTQLTDAERNAILGKISKVGETIAQPPSAVDSQNEDSGAVPFGVLLERTVKLQEELKNEDHSKDDEIREKVIEKSKLDMIGKMMKGFGF